MSVILYRPMNPVAGQPIPAAQRGDAPVFQPAKPTLSSSPDGTLSIEANFVHTAFAQPVGRSVGGSNLSVLEVDQSAFKESEPQATLNSIARHSCGQVRAAQSVPWDLLYQLAVEH